MTKEDLRIVFFGTPEFAVCSLRALVDGGYNIVGVVTMPDKPAGRGKHLMQSDVKRFAVERGLPVLQPVSLKDPQFIDALRALQPQLQIVIAFRMLPEAVWSLPPLGTFNLHASLLPRYRGAAPINWAVINGDTQTGVTTFFLRHEIDTGDIIRQQAIDISRTDNAGDVHDRLMEIGAKMVIDTVNDVLAGKANATPQSACAEQPTPAPKIFKEDCRINWQQPAERVYNLIRGLAPYPGAFSSLQRGDGSTLDIKIYATAEPVAAQGTLPPVGTLRCDDNKSLWVACADAWLPVLQLQQPGKRRMPIDEFLRGFHPNDCKFL